MKTYIKRFFIPILASRPITALASRFLGTGIPIFMLHRMDTGNQPYSGLAPDYLRRCLDYLSARQYAFVSLEDAVLAIRNEQPLPDKSVVFTLDDGYWDQAEIAAPIFIEYDCPVTIFLITGMLDQNTWPWDAKVSHLINTSQLDSVRFSLANRTINLPLTNNKERSEARRIVRDALKTLDNERIDEFLEQLASATRTAISQTPPHHLRFLSWETARTLEQEGIKFAPHSITHRMLSMLNQESSELEITGSWQRLKEELDSPSPVFCYPTGRQRDYGPREINIIKKIGLIGAVSTIPKCAEIGNSPPDYLYNLPRFNLPSEFEDFIQYCTWIERFKS